MQRIASSINRHRTAFAVLVIIILFHTPITVSYFTDSLNLSIASAYWGEDTIKNILFSIMQSFGSFSLAGVAMLSYITKPEVVLGVLDGGEGAVVYRLWAMVRDVLNLFFILILLFSAFATIFQVEKFNLRSLLLRLVLMALFVNFSLPIARFLIDASNIIMYFFLNSLFPKSLDVGMNISSTLGNCMNIANIISPGGYNPDLSTAYILVGIVFSVLFAMTMVAVSGILVVRLIVLVILMIFSPIAFVANILPSTAEYAAGWWKNMFKYAFAGPIMIFFLFFAVVFLKQIHTMSFDKSNVDGKALLAFTTAKTSTDAATGDWIGDIAFLIIPMVVLWSGILSTMKMSGIMGGWMAGAVSTGALWLGKNMMGGKQIVQYIDYKTGAHGARLAQSIKPQSFKEKYQERASMSATARSTESTRKFAKEVDEAAKHLEHLSETDLEGLLNSGTAAEKAAAAQTMAAKGFLSTPAKLQKALDAIGRRKETVHIHENIESSLKKNNQAGTLAAYHAQDNAEHYNQTTGKWEKYTGPDREKAIANKYFSKMSSGQLAQQDLAQVRNTAIESHTEQIIRDKVRTDKDVQNIYNTNNINNETVAYMESKTPNHIWNSNTNQQNNNQTPPQIIV